jgi:hypothetical protein
LSQSAFGAAFHWKAWTLSGGEFSLGDDEKEIKLDHGWRCVFYKPFANKHTDALGTSDFRVSKHEERRFTCFKGDAAVGSIATCKIANGKPFPDYATLYLFPSNDGDMAKMTSVQLKCE